MRFMMLVKSSPEVEDGALPTTEELAEMNAFNQELVDAGVMLAGEGLQPSSRGAKIVFSDRKATVVDGPFTEAKEMIAGFWLIDVRSLDEAKEWGRRVPFRDGELEIRPVFEADDFGDGLTPELRAAGDEMRRTVEAQQRR
jgi:hypothetical protein